MRGSTNSKLKESVFDTDVILSEDLYTTVSIGLISASLYNPVLIAPSGQTLKNVFNKIFGQVTKSNGITYLGNDDNQYYQIIGVYSSVYAANTSVHTVANNAFVGVSDIREDAFRNCSYLSDVDIANILVSAGTIGELAFEGCTGFSSLYLPSTVSYMGISPFTQCNSLDTIVVDSNNSKYDSRDNCNAIIITSTNTLWQGCKNTTIPTTVTSLGRACFAEFNTLSNMTIPANVTRFGQYIFYGDTNLTSITYQGTIAQYQAITKEDGYNYETENIIVHCTNGNTTF